MTLKYSCFFDVQAPGRHSAAEPRRPPSVPKENVHAHAPALGSKASPALRPRSNSHDDAAVQELTEQVEALHQPLCLFCRIPS